MHRMRSALVYAIAGALIVGAYFVGSFAGGLLTASAHAMPPAKSMPRVPIAAEIADNVA